MYNLSSSSNDLVQAVMKQVSEDTELRVFKDHIMNSAKTLK